MIVILHRNRVQDRVKRIAGSDEILLGVTRFVMSSPGRLSRYIRSWGNAAVMFPAKSLQR